MIIINKIKLMYNKIMIFNFLMLIQIIKFIKKIRIEYITW